MHTDTYHGSAGSYFLVNNPSDVYVNLHRINISPKDSKSECVNCDL
jgi:hypothetical protein